MSIKSNLERAYCSLPIKVQEFLAPKSHFDEIQQGQKYSRTQFMHPETNGIVNYTQMLEYYKINNLAVNEFEKLEIKLTKSSYPCNFEEFAEPYIQKFEAGSIEPLIEGVRRIRVTLKEYGIAIINPKEQQPQVQDPLDNSPYDLDIYHN
jgi:hypothetical protein